MRKKDILDAVHGVEPQFFREVQQRAEAASQNRNHRAVLRQIGRGALLLGAAAGAAALAFTGIAALRAKPGTELQPGSTPQVEQSAGVLNTSEFEPATTAAADSTDQTETAVTGGTVYPPANERGAADIGVSDGKLSAYGSMSVESPLVNFAADSTAADMRWTPAYSEISCNADYLFCGRYRIALQPNSGGWNGISLLCQKPDCMHIDGTDCPLSFSDPISITGLQSGFLLRSGWTFRAYGNKTGNSYSVMWTDETAKQQLSADTNDRSVLGDLNYMRGKWFLIRDRSITCLGSSIGTQAQTLELPRNVTQITAADCFGSDVWMTADVRAEDSAGSTHIESKLLHWNLETNFYNTVLTVNNSLGVCCNSGYVYFVQHQADAPDGSQLSLCRLPVGGIGKPETVIAHFRCAKAQHWTVTEDSVYYYSNWRYVDTLGKYLRRGRGYGMLIRCDADGGAPHAMPLELYAHGLNQTSALQRYTDTERTEICLIDNRSCDSIFLLDLGKLHSGGFQPDTERAYDALFAIRRGTDAVTGCLLPNSIW